MSDYTEPVVLPPDDDTAQLPVEPVDYVPPFTGQPDPKEEQQGQGTTPPSDSQGSE